MTNAMLQSNRLIELAGMRTGRQSPVPEVWRRIVDRMVRRGLSSTVLVRLVQVPETDCRWGGSHSQCSPTERSQTSGKRNENLSVPSSGIRAMAGHHCHHGYSANSQPHRQGDGCANGRAVFPWAGRTDRRTTGFGGGFRVDADQSICRIARSGERRLTWHLS